MKAFNNIFPKRKKQNGKKIKDPTRKKVMILSQKSKHCQKHKAFQRTKFSFKHLSQRNTIAY